ncbi:MAG: 50S ribosomal protein L6 [Actinomycetota bacterium]|nr:50S ribosomal protein L6 [Actinomycetota bacterium]
MSRLGKRPVNIPEGAEIKIDKNIIGVKGKLGELSLKFDKSSIKLNIEDNRIVISPVSKSKESRAKYGLYRSLINNMVIGVTDGFTKTLKVVGVGYRAAKKGDKLELSVGYSNPAVVEPPEGITFDVVDNNIIKVNGIDKQLVGEVAAEIRGIREPEPYKGKGIRYEKEVVRRKVGKAAITTTT